MTRPFWLAILFTAAFVLAQPLAASAKDWPNYFAFRGGVFLPASGELEEGFSGEFAAGHHFSDGFALEGALGFVWVGDFDGSVNTVFGQVPADIDVWAMPVTVTAKGFLPLEGFELYAGAGAGLYLMEASATFLVLGFPASDNDTDVAVGGHLVAGGNVDVSETAFIGAEVRYLIADDARLSVANASLDIDLDGFSLLATLGFRF